MKLYILYLNIVILVCTYLFLIDLINYLLHNIQKKGPKDKTDSKKEKKENKEEPAISSTPKITSIFQKKTSSSPPDFLSQLPANFMPFSGTGRKLGSSSANPVISQTGGTGNSDKYKSKVTTSSPNKSVPGQKDISTYFTKPPLDWSSDSELLILSPPNKRKRLDPPDNKKESLMCPVCNKTGFVDLNMHANMCLNNQLLKTGNDSMHSPSKIKNSVPILDDSIEEIPIPQHTKTRRVSIKDYLNFSQNSNDSSKSQPSGRSPPHSSGARTEPRTSPHSGGARTEPRTCPVCGKAVTSDITKHLNVCMNSIPGDEDEVVVVGETDNKPGKSELLPVNGEDVKTPGHDKDLVQCPICERKFRQAMINTHLDLECLSFSEFS